MSKVALKSQVGVQYLGQKSANPTYWADPRPGNWKLNHDVKVDSIDDIMDALKEIGFLKQEKDIFRGISIDALVAFGIDTLGKAYVATDPPVPIPLPSPDGSVGPVQVRVVVYGPDFPLFRSNYVNLHPGDWQNFRLGD